MVTSLGPVCDRAGQLVADAWEGEQQIPAGRSGEAPAPSYDGPVAHAEWTTTPQHQIRWNFILDLPFGRNRAIGSNRSLETSRTAQTGGCGKWRRATLKDCAMS